MIAYFAVLVLICLRGAYPELPVVRSMIVHADADDFFGYYTAAVLVRMHLSPAIYEVADWHVDPVEQTANPSTIFAKTARTQGVPELKVPLYDYPPTLADLLYPMAFLRPRAAVYAWIVINLIAMVACGMMLGRVLGGASPAGLVILTLLLAVFRPMQLGFECGQIDELLLLLFLGGILLYAAERKHSAGLVFSLAGAIKLTPFLVIMPLLAWRDWRTLRAIALGSGIILFFLLAINGPHALDLYFFHELPKMTGKLTDQENRGLVNALQVLWLGTDATPFVPSLFWAGRILCAVLVGATVWLCRNVRPSRGVEMCRAEVLGSFFLLAACISPVSWAHAFVFGVPALAFVCKRIWEGRSNPVEASLVLVFVVAVSTYRFVRLEMSTPFVGAALALVAIQQAASRQARSGEPAGLEDVRQAAGTLT